MLDLGTSLDLTAVDLGGRLEGELGVSFKGGSLVGGLWLSFKGESPLGDLGVAFKGVSFEGELGASLPIVTVEGGLAVTVEGGLAVSVGGVVLIGKFSRFCPLRIAVGSGGSGAAESDCNRSRTKGMPVRVQGGPI